MIQIIDGKTYNTETMTTLASNSCSNHNGNYCGSDSIRVTKSGKLAFVATANGQDLYRHGYIEAVTPAEAAAKIDRWHLNDEEVAALTAHGIISEA